VCVCVCVCVCKEGVDKRREIQLSETILRVQALVKINACTSYKSHSMAF
jgi:hypothetical protein